MNNLIDLDLIIIKQCLRFFQVTHQMDCQEIIDKIQLKIDKYNTPKESLADLHKNE